MKPRRISETEQALYPVRELKLCSCGVTFPVRPPVEGDDPELCLHCNRSSWSRLFSKPATWELQVLPMRKRSR